MNSQLGQSDIQVRYWEAYDASEVAELHINGITTGFISSLGKPFVTALYEAMIVCEDCLGLVAVLNDRVVGFVSFAISLRQVYRIILRKKGIQFAFILSRHLFNLKRLRRILETLFYPQRSVQTELPQAELLSISVSETVQGQGIGRTLVESGLRYCAEQGIDRVKVLVGADNLPANRLYEKCGFVFHSQIESHGIVSNIHVAETS